MTHIARRPTLILGARSFAPVVADFLSEIPGYRVAAFVENMDPERCGGTLEGLPILWVADAMQLAESHSAVCALGSTMRKDFIEHVASWPMPFVTPVHSSAITSSKSQIGEGTIVSPGVIIAGFANVGRHVLLNRGALIGHNVEIGDYGTVGPGANIAGFVSIGEATYIGIGAVVLDGITIGANAVVGGGAVVTKDVPDNVMVVGIPAKIVKRGIEGL